jgi:hypothetical protein
MPAAVDRYRHRTGRAALCSEDGVDLTLIWMQSLSPPERLDILQDLANWLYEIRELNGLPGNPENVHEK